MRFLILSCSASKFNTMEPLPALDRYRGPAFTIVRRYLRTNPAVLTTDLQIAILSAEHGLIGPETRIPPYDRRMTRPRAAELQSQVTAELRHRLATANDLQIFLMLGKDYQPAIEPLSIWLPAAVDQVTIASGGSGRKQQQLKRWLAGQEPPAVEASMQMTMDFAESTPRGYATLRGVTVATTPDEILAQVERWIAEGDKEYLRSREWLAQVGPYTVAPKWLVSRLSGVPVSRFTADEARRVLQQLGIPLLSTGRTT